MNIKRFFLLSILYIMAISKSSSKAVYDSKANGNSESEDVKFMRPTKRKIQPASYVDNDYTEQKVDRCSKATKMSSVQDDNDNHAERLKGENLHKRTLFDSNFPYGVVYGNGRPIGILKPYPQSFELAPIRDIRVPTSERYARAVDALEEGDTSLARFLQKDSQYTNDKYPEILANFKIHNKVLKVQENRNLEPVNHKREEITKHANTTPPPTTTKAVVKRDVQNADDSDTVEDIEKSLKNIITELGLAPDEKSTNKRNVETSKGSETQDTSEDEDLESGSNKIAIHKESHDNAARTKKEGKPKISKKKSHKATIKQQDTSKEDEEEEEEDDEENYKRSSDKSKEQEEVTAAKRSEHENQAIDNNNKGNNENEKREDPKRSTDLENQSSVDSTQEKEQDVNNNGVSNEVERSSVVKRSNIEPKRDNVKENAINKQSNSDTLKSADVKRSANEKETFRHFRKRNREEDLATPKRSIKHNQKGIDSFVLKKPAANYQIEGEAYLRSKRQSGVTTDSTDIVKGLETSGELTVSGNKNPLASSNEESDYGKVKVAKKSTKELDKKPYDLELEKNIQKQIQAIKEQVKREIEELRIKQEQEEPSNVSDLNGKQKRAVQNTLIDEEKDFLNPKIDEDSIKPHKRSKRDFDTDMENELNQCTSSKSVKDKRYVEIKPSGGTLDVFNDKIQIEDIKDGDKKMTRESKLFDNNLYNNDNREIRRTKDSSKISDKELVSSVAESDAMYKTLKSRSNDKLFNYKTNEDVNDDIIQVDTNESKYKMDDVLANSYNVAGVKKRNAQETDSKRTEKNSVKENDTKEKASDKMKRMKSDVESSSEANNGCKSVTDSDANENESERKKRKENDIGNRQQQQQKPINLYDVALKKRELSPQLQTLEVKNDVRKIGQNVQLNSRDNKLEIDENDNNSDMKKRNTFKNLTKDSKLDDTKLIADENVKKRNVDTPNNDAMNYNENDVKGYPVKKRESVSLYVPNVNEKEEANVNNIKCKRNRDAQENVKLTQDKLYASNEIPSDNNLLKIEKSNSMDRLKRNEENNEKSEVNKNKITEKTDEISKEEVDKKNKRNEAPETLEDASRNKRNKIANEEVKNLQPIKNEVQSDVKDNEYMTKNDKKRSSNIFLNPNYYINEDDEERLRDRRDLQNKNSRNDRKVQSVIVDDQQNIKSRDATLNERKIRKRRRLITDGEKSRRGKRNDLKNENKKNPKPTETKNIEKSSNKTRRDMQKDSTKRYVKERDTKEQTRQTATMKKNVNNRRTIRSNNLNRPYLNQILIHKRKKRSNMMYFPYRGDEEIDEEGEEFDDDVIDDRSVNFKKKRETNSEQSEDEAVQEDDVNDKESLVQGDNNNNNENRIMKRNSVLRDYVADINADSYENPNEYLYENGRFNRRKRKKRDNLEDDEYYLLHGKTSNNNNYINNNNNIDNNNNNKNRKSIKREVDIGNSRGRKNNLKYEGSMFGLSDADLFGSLPQSYDGELSRFKRVKRSNNVNEDNDDDNS